MQDSTWPAVSLQGTIRAGQRAVIAYRENLVWMIEPLEELENGGTQDADKKK